MSCREDIGMADYYGFRQTGQGFSVCCTISFLSHGLAWAYCKSLLKMHGRMDGKSMRYRDMTCLRMAQELWFHAVAYYCGAVIRATLSLFRVKWNLLDKLIGQARYIEVDAGDARAIVFAVSWWVALVGKVALAFALANRLIG